MSTIMGLKNIEAAIQRHKKATAKGIRVGMLRGGLFLLRESQKIVPIDKSFLKASSDVVTRIEGEGFDSMMTVGYGQDYAVYVHENLEARHKPGTSAKYLEKPLREKKERIAEIVADGIREFLE